MTEKLPSPTPFADALQKHADDLATSAQHGGQGGLEVTVDREAVSAEVSTKIGNNWSVGAWASWAYDGTWNAAAKVKAWWGGAK